MNARQHQHELLATKAGHQIVSTQVRTQDVCHLAQDGIANRMRVPVIDVLEVIHVSNHHRQRLMVSTGLRERFPQVILEVATIGDARQAVLAGLTIKQLGLFAQTSVDRSQFQRTHTVKLGFALNFFNLEFGGQGLCAPFGHLATQFCIQGVKPLEMLECLFKRAVRLVHPGEFAVDACSFLADAQGFKHHQGGLELFTGLNSIPGMQFDASQTSHATSLQGGVINLFNQLERLQARTAGGLGITPGGQRFGACVQHLHNQARMFKAAFGGIHLIKMRQGRIQFASGSGKITLQLAFLRQQRMQITDAVQNPGGPFVIVDLMAQVKASFEATQRLTVILKVFVNRGKVVQRDQFAQFAANQVGCFQA